MKMNSPEGKSVLELVRGAAFAHAGEAEAIDMALAFLSKDPDRQVLDAGCGLGGTADYVTRHGWGKVTGFDIDGVSIEKAKTRYPECAFVTADAGQVSSHWHDAFDLIYSFNAVYAFPDQAGVLQQFFEVAKPGATLVIFDYTDPTKAFAASALHRREEVGFWQPLHPATFEQWAMDAGWKLQNRVDLSTEYIRWYEGFLNRLDSRREEIVARHGQPIFEFVRSFYGELKDTIAARELGGGLFIFRKDANG